MTELEIMKRAQEYLKSLANGIDPLTGNTLPAGDIVSNVRISRCLSYAADVLQKVVDNGGEVQAQRVPVKSAKKLPFSLTEEQAAALRPEDDRLFISKVVDIINAQIDENTMKKLKPGLVNAWLTNSGLLSDVVINGKTYKRPTEQGEQLGISLTSYYTQSGMFVKNCVYNADAQQFIFDNLDAILAYSEEWEADKAALKELSRLQADSSQSGGTPTDDGGSGE